MKNPFLKGLKDGIPIALGYLSVSLGFGILCIRLGISLLGAVSISATNLTSAGQVAGVGVIAAGGTLIEMALTQLVINLRYSLMGIALSQKLAPGFTVPQRMIAAFGITDEIFAVAYAQKEQIKAPYLYGLTVISTAGWVSGTFLGAALGQVLPSMLSDAMGIMLYGMFLAVVIPPAKKDRGILLAVLVAAGCSVGFTYLLPQISGGFAVILCAIISAVICSLLCPADDAEEVGV